MASDPPACTVSSFRYLVTAIIVNYRTPELTIDCLKSLSAARCTGIRCNAVVVDGFSGDGSADRIESEISKQGYGDWVTLRALPFNGGFGWANNYAIASVMQDRNSPDYVMLINPDAVPQIDAIQELKNVMDEFPDVAAAGSQLIDETDARLGSAFIFPSIWTELVRGAGTPSLGRVLRIQRTMIQSRSTVDVDWVTGASVMIRTQALREVGLFDEGFFLYFEEVELMHRLRGAGWRIMHVPSSLVRHIGGAATGVSSRSGSTPRLPDYWFQSRRRFFTLAYGRQTAALASLAWIVGLMIWRLRCVIGLGRASDHAPFEFRDLLRTGIVPTSVDHSKAAPAWNVAPSPLPAWAMGDD